MVTESHQGNEISKTVVENDQFKKCDKCNDWLNSERDLRLHNAKHIHHDPVSSAAT